MNKKRLIAFMTAALMLTSTMPVYAAEATSADYTASPSGTVIVTGESGTAYADVDDKFVVTLPTAKGLNIVLDPQGLFELANGEAIDFDSTATGAGHIISNVASIINRSSTDVSVKMVLKAMNVTGGATGLDNADNIEFVNTQATIGNNTNKEMMLVAVPALGKAYGDYEFDTNMLGNKAFEITGGGTNINYTLAASQYEVVNKNGAYTYQIKDIDDNYDVASFKIAGDVNRLADWSAYDTTPAGLQINAAFSFEKADTTPTTGADILIAVDDIYKLASGSATSLVNYKSPAVDATAFVVENMIAIGYTQELGLGITKKADVTSVKMNGEALSNYDATETGFVTIPISSIESKLAGKNELVFEVATIGGRTYEAVIPLQ